MIELVTLQVTQWRSVFWISAGVHIAGSGLYLLFGSDQVVSFKLFPLIRIISFQNISLCDQVQDWAKPESTAARIREVEGKDVNRNTQTSHL